MSRHLSVSLLLACVVVLCVAVLCRSAPPPPTIVAVSGCAVDVGNATTLCYGGDWVDIRGSRFDGTGLQVWLVRAGRYPALKQTYVNSTAIRAQLPYVPAWFPDGTLYDVQVSSAGVLVNASALVNFTSQQPVVDAISGCVNNTANATSGCVAGMTITLRGRLFVGSPSSITVQVFGAGCSTVTVLSSTRLTCRLLPLDQYYTQQQLWARVQSATTLWSYPAYLLAYDPSPPSILSIRGCASAAGNGTTACNYNDSIVLRGSKLPNSSVTVLITGMYGTVFATDVVVHNSTTLTARLPYVATNGSAVGVQVSSSTVMTNVATDLIAYASQVPGIWRATGCAVNNHTANTTSGCVPGTLLVIDGHHFVPSNVTTYALTLVMGGLNGTRDCTFISTARIACVLPAVPKKDYHRLLSVRVYVGRYSSDTPLLVMYGSGDGTLPSSPAAPDGDLSSVRERPAVSFVRDG